MKILYILPLLLFCNITFAQELPVIPMKNGLVYYEFKHILTNEKNCISLYFEDANLKVGLKNQTVLTAKQVQLHYEYHFEVGERLKRNKVHAKCSDTLNTSLLGFGISIPITSSLLPQNFDDKKSNGKIFGHGVSANVEVIFLNKNEYILKFKDFQYSYLTMSKNLNTYGDITTVQIPLGELYQEFLNTEKKTKYQIEFFNAINYFINSSDEIYLKSLTELYQADEL